MDKKKLSKWILICAGIVVAVLAIGFIVLLNSDIGSEQVAKELESAGQAINGDISVSSVRGNPIVGYSIEGLSLTSPVGLDLSAEKINLNLDLSGLLKGKVALSSVNLKRVAVDIKDPARLKELFPAGPGGELVLPELEINVSDIAVTIPQVSFAISQGKANLSPSAVDFSFKGKVSDIEVEEEGRVRIDKGTIVLEKDTVRMGGAVLEASGKLYPELDLSGKLEGLDLVRLTALWPASQKLGVEGKLSGAFTARGPLSAPSIEGELAVSGGKIYGTAIDKATGKWRFAEGKLYVEPIEGKVLGASVGGSLALTLENLQTKLTLNAEGFDLAQARQIFPKLPPVEGKVEKATLSLAGSLLTPTGEVKVSIPSLKVAGIPVESIEATAGLSSKKEISLSSKGLFMGSQATATGKVFLEEEPRINVSLAAPGLSLKKVTSYFPQTQKLNIDGNAEVKLTAEGKAFAPNLSGTLRSDSVTVQGVALRSIDASFALEGDSFVVNSASAKLYDGTLSASGRIESLLKEPVLALQGDGKGLPVEAARSFVPAIPEGVAGKVDVEWKASGKLASPSIEATARSSALNLYKGMSLKALEAQFAYAPQKLEISKAKASLLDGSLEAAGAVSLADGGALDVKGSFKEVSLGALPFEAQLPLEGRLSGTFQLSGALTAPALQAEAQVPHLTAGPVSLENIQVALKGSPTHFATEKLTASLGGAPIVGKVEAKSEEGKWKANFEASGEGINAAKFLSEGYAGLVEGTLNFNFNGEYGGSLKGTGRITSPELTVRGARLNDVELPVALDGEKLSLGEGNALLYGGKLTAGVALWLEGLEWQAKVHAEGVDMEPLLKEVVALEGRVTGKASLDLEAKGKGANTKNLSGQGKFQAKDGEIADFKAVKAAAAIAGRKSIPYSTAAVNFVMDGVSVYIMPGSHMTAPAGDPLYRYVNIDGSVFYTKRLELHGMAEVNLQVLNAFVGAVKGVATGGASIQEALQGLLGGIMPGSSTGDFREVSFDIAGTFDSPKLMSLQVQRKPTEQQPTGTTDDKQQLKLDIPVGSGTESGNSTGDQLKKQILQQIFKSIQD
ncbi:AsmA-like C-terminal region-containing protein [Acetomicrobium sp. S15 = DSM 107314]|uniref:AsmA-like C-terminal region-containing protein n=1 Tax=Acetomicrobium sp. S15 = DSM 107314 TaxID=2529858 RepID=UPI0018E1B257